MSATATRTATYTAADIQKVVRRFSADITMIAQSTCALTEAKAREYAHDVEELSIAGYLSYVDVTLLEHGVERCAVRYDVNKEAGGLTTSRPGGVEWPKCPHGFVRIVLGHSATYDADARARMAGRLRVNWSPTDTDTTHAGLRSAGGRDYASNGWGFQRRDWS